MRPFLQKRGAALFIVVVIAFTVSAISATYITASISNKNKVEASVGTQKAMYAAEAGANYAARVLIEYSGQDEDARASTTNDSLATVPNFDNDLRYEASTELVEVIGNEHRYRITSTGIYGNPDKGGYKKTIRMTLTGNITHKVFYHAIYAATNNIPDADKEPDTVNMTFGGCPVCGGTGIVPQAPCSTCGQTTKKNLWGSGEKYVVVCGSISGTNSGHNWTSELFIPGYATCPHSDGGCNRTTNSKVTPWPRWHPNSSSSCRECRYVAPTNVTYYHYRCKIKGYNFSTNDFTGAYCEPSTKKLYCGSDTGGHNWYNDFRTVTAMPHTNDNCLRGNNPTASDNLWWSTSAGRFLRCVYIAGDEQNGTRWIHRRCKNSCTKESDGKYIYTCGHGTYETAATYTTDTGHGHGCTTAGGNAWYYHTDSRCYRCYPSGGQAEGWRHYSCSNNCREDASKSWKICPTCSGNGYPSTKPCPACSGNGHDTITGDVYNSGNIDLNNLAEVEEGEVKANEGTVTTANGNSNIEDPSKIINNAEEIEPPNIPGMHYPQRATTGNVYSDVWDPNTNPNGKYINVANEFNKHIQAGTDVKIGITSAEAGFKLSEGIQTVPATSPAHILAQHAYVSINDYSTKIVDPSTMTSAQQDAWVKRQYFLMDLASGPKDSNGKCTNGGEKIVVKPAHNDKVYYIDGNLWIESNGKGPGMITEGSEATRPGMKLTFVVLGNIYICDAVYYDKTKDAAAFLAIAGGEESYVDLDGDNKFTVDNPATPEDEGDILLNDKANTEGNLGTYDGPPEGRGNIYFGDPCGTSNNTVCWATGTNKNSNPMDTFYGYLYSENDFLACGLENNVSSDGKSSVPFKVYGMYCAGGRMQIDRDFTGTAVNGNVNKHTAMIVTYDNRIQHDLELPGLPQDNEGHPTQWKVTGYTIVGCTD